MVSFMLTCPFENLISERSPILILGCWDSSPPILNRHSSACYARDPPPQDIPFSQRTVSCTSRALAAPPRPLTLRASEAAFSFRQITVKAKILHLTCILIWGEKWESWEGEAQKTY